MIRSTSSELTRWSQMSLGSRLTLIILPIIILTFIIIGAGTYFRARDILKNQTDEQMATAAQGLDDLALFTVALILGTTVILILIIPFFTRYFLKPLRTLTDFSERVASGDFQHRVEMNRTDEIGRLAGSLNHMADELTQFYRSLEARVFQRTKEVRLAAEMARDAASSRDIDELLRETIRLITDRFTYYHVGIFLLDEAKQKAVMKAASSEGGKRMQRRSHSLPVGKTGIVGFVAETGETRRMRMIGDDPAYYANPDLPETQSEIAIPLKVSGAIIGVLDIQSRQPNAFSEADVILLQIIADQLAVAIENNRLLKRQIGFAEQRSKIIEIFNQLSRALNYDDLLEEIPDLIRETFELSRVTLALVEGENVVIQSISSSDDASLPPPVDTSPIGQGVLGRSVTSKSPQQLTQQPTHELETQDPRLEATRSILAIPLIIRDKVIGSLALESGKRSELEKDEVEAFEIIASLGAITIENAYLREEMQQSSSQIDLIYQQQTANAWAHLLSRRYDKGEAHVDYGFPDAAASLEDPGIGAPIELRGEIIGNLGLRGIKTGEWSEEDHEILEAVADELANALEQTRLLEEINRRVAQLQTAAEIARSASGLMDLDSLLNRAVTLVQERFNYTHVSIYLIDEEGKQVILQAGTGEEGQALKQDGFQYSIGSESVIGKVMETGDHYVANQTSTDPIYTPNPLLPGTKAELGVPLKIGASVIGAFDVHDDHVDAFGDDDIAVLRILADQVAIAVQNVRLFEQTYLRAEREKSVVEITSRIRETRDVDSMLQIALRELQDALGASTGRIRLSDQIGDGRDDGKSGTSLSG
jgi:GAF domain-containing protein/HAMP domain-containing protein